MSLFDVDYRPERKALRTFGVAAAILLGVAAASMWARSPMATTSLVVASIVSVVVAITRPEALRWPFVALSLATWPIGLVVSWVVLAVVFYAVFAPVGLVMRLFGRDALGRRFERSTATYWTERRPVEDPGRYFRQY